jgi:hypothetical protein
VLRIRNVSNADPDPHHKDCVFLDCRHEDQAGRIWEDLPMRTMSFRQGSGSYELQPVLRIRKISNADPDPHHRDCVFLDCQHEDQAGRICEDLPMGKMSFRQARGSTALQPVLRIRNVSNADPDLHHRDCVFLDCQHEDQAGRICEDLPMGKQ